GLKPKGRRSYRDSEAIPPEILEQAILLRRQVPSRSISQIIQILEWEGLAEPGQIKRSTLQEKLAERGYSARHMKLYAESGTANFRYFEIVSRWWPVTLLISLILRPSK